jgi:vacuolar-type H+-ATPase subunit F/Vma7
LSRVLALLGRDLSAGFALSGVEVTTVADAPSARAALDAAIQSGSYGLLILEEELVRDMGPEAGARLAALTVPLVIEVPGALLWREAQEAPADDYVARLIRRAVGYQLTIRL